MKIKDSFRLSVNSITHRRLRAWLTLLGIIIGVAAVVSIISIGNGAQASVSQRLSGFGADIITLSPGFSRATTLGGGRGGFDIGGGGGGFGGGNGGTTTVRASSSTSSTPVLTNSDVEVLKNDPNIITVNQIVSGRAPLTFGSQKTNVAITGVNPNTWLKTINVTLASGRFLGPSDNRSVVIGDSLANSRTFSQPITLNRKVDINGVAFTVVGILAPSGTSFGGGGDSSVYMTYTAAWDVVDVNKNNFSSIQAKVSDASLVTADINSLTEKLFISRRVNSRTQNFSLTSAQALQQQIQSVTSTLTLFLAAIAAVSLLVGAVGIANSMFTSVLEKTREIGIMKALGATNNEVLKLFVIESGLFGLIGGIIGVLIAFTLTTILNLLDIGLSLGFGPSGSFTFVITPDLVLLAIGLSTIIGIVSGIIPARNASKLKPVDALKYE